MSNRELRPYQELGRDFAQENKSAGLFMDMGLGKTAVILHALADLPGPTLLVGPLRVVETVWHREALEWEATERMSFSLIRGTPKQREKAMLLPADVYLVNPEMLEYVLTHGDCPTFRNLVIDESTLFKNPSTKRFKLIRRHLRMFERRILATGTPTPNSLMDLWSQIFILDGGERLGTAFGKFQRKYFYTTDFQGYKWEAHDWAQEEILGLCKDVLYRISAKDVLKRDEPFHNPIVLDLPPKAQRLYDEMAKNAFLTISKQETLSAATAAANLMKLRQMASGFSYTDEEGTVQIHTAKVDALREIVESSQGRPLIVVYQFNHELEALQKAFPKGWVFTAELQDDWNEGAIPILFLHPQTGGHGLNLQYGGSEMVIFSSTFSYEQITQVMGRIDRQGQENPVVFHHLIARGTVDELLKEVIDGKSKNQASVLAMIKEYADAYAKTNRR